LHALDVAVLGAQLDGRAVLGLLNAFGRVFLFGLPR
jgi:hypothetical protein